MAIIKPFKALRPYPSAAKQVASVPYDVVNREEALNFAKESPLSFLRVTRAEIEMDNSVNPYSPEVYKKAKENLERIKIDAPLLIEEQPCFYLYKLVMSNRTQIGIAATFSIEDYDNNVILKHEKTRKDKEDDRTNHIMNTGAQTGPVFLTYKGVHVINEIVDKTIIGTQPVYDFVAPDSISHTIWILPAQYNNLIISEIAKVKNLYIADGHHRAASAVRVGKEKKVLNPAHTGMEEYNFFLGVLFPKEQLKILPYNRVLIDLNGLTKEEFLNKINKNFSVVRTSSPKPAEAHSFAMYISKEWYLLKPNNIKPSKSIGENLDVSILQNYLLHPVLDIEDPRTSKRIDFIGGIRGTEELIKLVDQNKAAAAFSLFPVTVDDLMRMSDAGEIMPPKSTWFEPKLRDGLLVHLI